MSNSAVPTKGCAVAADQLIFAQTLTYSDLAQCLNRFDPDRANFGAVTLEKPQWCRVPAPTSRTDRTGRVLMIPDNAPSANVCSLSSRWEARTR